MDLPILSPMGQHAQETVKAIMRTKETSSCMMWQHDFPLASRFQRRCNSERVSQVSFSAFVAWSARPLLRFSHLRGMMYVQILMIVEASFFGSRLPHGSGTAALFYWLLHRCTT